MGKIGEGGEIVEVPGFTSMKVLVITIRKGSQLKKFTAEFFLKNVSSTLLIPARGTHEHFPLRGFPYVLHFDHRICRSATSFTLLVSTLGQNRKLFLKHTDNTPPPLHPKAVE